MTLKNGGIEESTTKEIEAINIRETIAVNIVAYRKKLKLSRAELAKRVGVTEAAVGQYERGTRTPQIDVVCRLADALNVPVDKLVGHGASNYDAVLEFRFERATNFLWNFELFTFEDKEGKISIRRSKVEKPNFKLKHGVITTDEVDKKFETLLTFSDRTAFVVWLENLNSTALSSNEYVFKKIIEDSLECLANNEPYEPLVSFFYKGNQFAFNPDEEADFL